jgi:transposase
LLSNQTGPPLSDTVAGAQASAMIYSIMQTCRAFNVEPYGYVRHLVTKLPQRQLDADITDLLPFNFELQSITAVE